VQPVLEFHIAVNFAPTPGVGGPALQGTCVVSDSPIPQASASAPGPLHTEQVAGLEENTASCSAPDPRPVGRKVHIPKASKTLLQMLSESVETGRVPSAHDILTWMDAEHAEVDGFYLNSYSDFQTFGIEDTFDIMEKEVCYLATFGPLGRGGALKLRHYTRDSILTPLGLWETKPDSIGSVKETIDMHRLFKWRNEVEEGYVEEIEDSSDTKVEVVEEVEEVEDMGREESSGIVEVEGWEREVNMGTEI
jgi:hypothetical protein